MGCDEEEQIKMKSCSERESPDGSNIIKAKKAFQEREQVTSRCGRELEKGEN